MEARPTTTDSEDIPFSPTPFKISIPQSNVDSLHALLKLSPLPPQTYEGSDFKFGITNAWMKEAKSHWLDTFNWSRLHTFDLVHDLTYP